MIQSTPEIQIKVAEKKKQWERDKKNSDVLSSSRFCCAFCMSQRTTLKKSGKFMICFDPKGCNERKEKLSGRDLAFLSNKRAEVEFK